MMDVFVQDFVFAARALRRRPGFTIVAVLTLAIGIGANVGIFSVVNGVLLNPLPYENADRIGILWHEFGDGAQNLPALHALDLRDYRERSEVFEDFTLATGQDWILGEDDEPAVVEVGIVESGFFEFFGSGPMLGRSFTAEEDVEGAAPVVVLSHRLWAGRFGSSPDIVGRSIDLAGERMEVIGVAPASFRLHLPAEAFRLRDAEVWANLRLSHATEQQRPRNFTGYTGFARLRPGATFAQGQAELEVMEEQLKAEHPEHAASGLQARVVPLHDDVVKGAESTLLFLFGAVGFVLLIASANVANLVIVRSQARAGEFSLRAALGGRRGGLIRLALMESAVLSACGAGLGSLLAMGGLELLTHLGPGSVPRLGDIHMDMTVLLFVAFLSVVTAAAFGLVPAIRTTASDPGKVLGSDRRATGGRSQRRFRDILVVGQVAASLVLLVGAGLMVRSFSALTSVDPGYDTEGILTFRVSLPIPAFADNAARQTFHAQFAEAIQALPSVTGVGTISQLPLTGIGPLQPFAYDEITASNWESVTGDGRSVTPGYFHAMGAEFVRGRDFTSADAEGELSVIVDDRLVSMAFPGEDPVGRLLQIGPDGTPEELRYARIVGVVKHLRVHDLSRPHLTQIYRPAQGSARFAVAVRTSGDPNDLVAQVRAELQRLAPGAPMDDVRPISDLVENALASDRLALALMTGFGIIALILASVGIYGVLSYTVAQRTREIGVRMALGQSPGAVRRVVLVEGSRLIALALALGLGVAAVLSRNASSLLFGIQPIDPPTYLATTAVLSLAALAACWIPARRATRINPLEAIRAE